MNVEAELLWIRELQNRQDKHVQEVRRLLENWPKGKDVSLTYGPGMEASGLIERVDQDLVSLCIREGWKKIVPLLQVKEIGGVEVETVRLLERPRVEGLKRVRVGCQTSE